MYISQDVVGLFCWRLLCLIMQTDADSWKLRHWLRGQHSGKNDWSFYRFVMRQSVKCIQSKSSNCYSSSHNSEFHFFTAFKKNSRNGKKWHFSWCVLLVPYGSEAINNRKAFRDCWCCNIVSIESRFPMQIYVKIRWVFSRLFFFTTYNQIKVATNRHLFVYFLLKKIIAVFYYIYGVCFLTLQFRAATF